MDITKFEPEIERDATWKTCSPSLSLVIIAIGGLPNNINNNNNDNNNNSNLQKYFPFFQTGVPRPQAVVRPRFFLLQ